MSKKLPHICPSCSSLLNVKSLICSHCDTEVSGNYNLPVLASLTEEDQQFIISFVKCSGSLKIMAQDLGLSYPTVRNMLDDVILKLGVVQRKSTGEI
ncbi:hypothetical protein CJD36_019715 [Flavipsychrobacter stenotrophus]|uniref:DUF2089 domain-containing protein n=1 Tax=Flavipsychrobacter stenotrophus TaxID=2077091 RepID=A0A2S7SRC9_9BACT|nr:DUF2089 family protein [Flavipsychrobacter stenotrophus]PQJ09470.1 hypothetical protein CJD36_019715 [Flavipsychrobacter stenotrophus]